MWKRAGKMPSNRAQRQIDFLDRRPRGGIGLDQVRIIIDDPLKPEEALSQTRRRAATSGSTIPSYSRLNDKLDGAIVLIMHRLHESLPSGLPRGMIWSATCWPRKFGRS